MSLFKDAILQANELKRIALEQARENLQETITPRISSMLNNALNEEADDELEEAINESEQEELEEDFDLSGFVSEEQAPEEEEPSFDEPSEEVPAEEPASDAPAVDTDSSIEGGEEGAEISDETSISDLTVGELKGLLSDIISGGSDELDIASFDDDVASSELDSVDSASTTEPEVDPTVPSTDDDEDDLNLESILAEVELQLTKPKAESLQEEIKRLKKELLETQAVLRKQTAQLKESNLLAAKNLYMNRLFKAFTLTESEKAKVLKNIDKAKTSKEAKAIYEALELTIKDKVKKPNIQESLGFASKPAGIAPSTGTPGSGILGDDAKQRLKFLAGIK